MRHRINLTIAPLYYAELQRICNEYKFSNLCEICIALISVFIQYVNKAERRRNPEETHEEFIGRMFREFESWEPTPESATMYKRRHTRRIDPNEDTSAQDKQNNNGPFMISEECAGTLEDYAEAEAAREGDGYTDDY